MGLARLDRSGRGLVAVFNRGLWIDGNRRIDRDRFGHQRPAVRAELAAADGGADLMLMYILKLLILLPLIGFMIWGSLKLAKKMQGQFGAPTGGSKAVRIVETKDNYRKFVRAFHLFDATLSGQNMWDVSVTRADVRIVRGAVRGFLGESNGFHAFVNDTFRHFCARKTQIVLNFYVY